MRYLLRRYVFPLGVVLIVLCSPVGARAAHIVVDARSGEVLLAEAAAAPWHPASLTKMMTVYLVLEALDIGAIELTDTLTVTPRAAAQPPTRVGLSTGDAITIEDAIEAIIVRSANDAAVAVADAMAGTEQAFAALMTAKAQELGMSGTVFHNASGLPHPDQVTTARDMAILGRALIRNFPIYYEFFSTRWASIRGRTLPTYNGLIASYDGADGIKTGFTCASGYNVVTSAERNGRRLIGVVLGSKNGAARTMQMRALLDAGFRMNPERVDGPELIDVGRDGVTQPTAPPRVLGPEECGRHQEPVVVKGAPGKVMPGWGITLGAFASQKEAQSRLSTARSRLGATINGARSTLVEKRAGKMRRYTALLTSLSQTEAATACRLLQRQKSFCVALGPEALGNSRARWW